MSNLGDARVALEFFSDVLFVKGIIDQRTADAIYEATCVQDLDAIIDEMVGDMKHE